MDPKTANRPFSSVRARRANMLCVTDAVPQGVKVLRSVGTTTKNVPSGVVSCLGAAQRKVFGTYPHSSHSKVGRSAWPRAHLRKAAVPPVARNKSVPGPSSEHRTPALGSGRFPKVSELLKRPLAMLWRCSRKECMPLPGERRALIDLSGSWQSSSRWPPAARKCFGVLI